MKAITVALWAEPLLAGYTGTRTFLESIVSRWIENYSATLRLSFIVTSEAQAQSLRERFPGGDWKVLHVRGSKWRLRLLWLAGQRSLSREIGPHDIYLSGWHWPLGRHDRPFVGIIHDLRLLDPEWVDPTIGALRRGIWRFLYRRSAKACLDRAAAIAAPSEFTLKHARSVGIVPHQATYIIPHGIDRERWSRHVTPPELASALGRHGVPAVAVYALTIGQHTPHKNTVRLVEAFASGPARSDPEAHLLLAGSYNVETPQLRKRIAAHGLQERIKLLGPVSPEELPILMAGARLFAFVSLFEGFGIPVLEAFAAGTPVLTSRTSSLGEVAGNAAVTVDPSDTEEISNALLRLWDDEPLRRELVSRGLQRAAGHSWDDAASRYVEVFKQVIRDRQ